MSRTFYIQNPEAPKVMSTEELLDLVGGNFRQFALRENDEDLDEVMQMSLNEFGYMLLGQEGISGRGFECSYSDENHSYDVRVFTPSTSADWHGALSFIERLASHFGVTVTDEEGKEYEGNNITYDYRHDIEFGVKCFDKSREGHFIFGVKRPICLSEPMIDKLLAAEDKVKAFDDFVAAQLQHEDIYIARPTFYRNDKGEVMGVYTLTKTVQSILPYEYPPFIDITKFNITQKDIKEWRICFVNYDENLSEEDNFVPLGDLDYKTFLERFPQEKIQKLDGHYMNIRIDTKAEIEALLGKKKGFLDKIKGLFS
jgi:hypothetical protein